MDKELKIGDMVKIKAILLFEYEERKRVINRYEIEPILGIVNGWTVRRTGMKDIRDSSDNWNLRSDIDDYHDVWIVTRLKDNQRYNIPLICFAEDLELVGRYQ